MHEVLAAHFCTCQHRYSRKRRRVYTS